MKKQIVLVGGDQRTPYLAKILSAHNYDVLLYGMERFPNLPLGVSITYQITPAPVYILPIPFTKDNSNINAPFSAASIDINEFLLHCQSQSIVFGGNIPAWFQERAAKKKLIVYDYGKSEQFAIDNALPTAEGTIEILMNQTPYVLEGKSICIVGYGRIGKILAKKLKALDCKVTVTARKASHLRAISQMGYLPLETKKLSFAPGFDIIINTVPAPVVNEAVLKNQPKNCFIVDLASNPGGVDIDCAKKFGFKTLHALSLPAKHAPETAAAIIANTILEFLHETE